jgi:hypothetical protein
LSASLCQPLQPTRTDPVRAFFVLLYLLKRNADSVCELSLTHLQHDAPHANAVANMLINWIIRHLLTKRPLRLFQISGPAGKGCAMALRRVASLSLVLHRIVVLGIEHQEASPARASHRLEDVGEGHRPEVVPAAAA